MARNSKNNHLEVLFRLFKNATSLGEFHIEKAKEENEAWAILTRIQEVRKLTRAGSSQADAVKTMLQKVFHNMSTQDRLILGTALGDTISNWPASEEGFSLLDLNKGCGFILSKNTLGVTERRKTLINKWTELRDMLGISHLAAPADTNLRNKLEPDAMHRFAQAILDYDTPNNIKEEYIGKALVFGAAVIDIGFHLHEELPPAPETSTQAKSITVSPGGKGLTQAVALARMGFDVSFITVIGDHIFDSSMIIDTLTLEGINTKMVKLADSEMTPVTGVITFKRGTSCAIGNKSELKLTKQIIDECFDECNTSELDFIFITYELPFDIIGHILRKLAECGNSHIKTIITPAPPASDPRDTINPTGIHYLVASVWEAQEFLGTDYADVEDISLLADGLLKYGIRTVCIPTDGQVIIKSKVDEIDIKEPAQFLPKRHDNTGERDAFCAALAYIIQTKGGVVTKEDVPFIASAMTISTMETGVSSSMPTVKNVEDFMQRYATEFM